VLSTLLWFVTTVPVLLIVGYFAWRSRLRNLTREGQRRSAELARQEAQQVWAAKWQAVDKARTEYLQPNGSSMFRCTVCYKRVFFNTFPEWGNYCSEHKSIPEQIKRADKVEVTRHTPVVWNWLRKLPSRTTVRLGS